MRVIVEVTGLRAGPIAGEQVARLAEEAGAWGIFFESDDLTAESVTVHAAVAATTHLHIGAWVAAESPFVAAEQLSVLDAVSEGRAFGLARQHDHARQVEAVLSGREIPAGPDGIGDRTPTVRLSPPTQQAVLTVLVVGDHTVAHPLLGDLSVVALPAEELLHPGVDLSTRVRRARIAGWQGPEIAAVEALA